MLFHVNNDVKKQMFNNYKKAAEDYQFRKENERRRRIQEERNYLADNQRREIQEQNRIRQNKIRQQNEERREYQKMLSNKSQNSLTIPKNRDIIINDYGYSVNPLKSRSINYRNNNNRSNYNFNNNNYRRMNLSQKERSIITTEDRMGVYLSDGVNNRYNNFVRNLKRNKHLLYKQMLDGQVNEKNNIDNHIIVNGQIYRYDNPLLKKQQEKFLDIKDPYKRNDDLRGTNLYNNPIADDFDETPDCFEGYL